MLQSFEQKVLQNKRTWKTVSNATTNVSKLLAGRPLWKFHLKTMKHCLWTNVRQLISL